MPSHPLCYQHRQSRGYIRLALVVVFLLAVGLSVYWTGLLSSHQTKVHNHEQQTNLRAAQLSKTLAVQAQTLFAGLDFLAKNLAKTYASGEMHGFELSVQRATSTFPAGALLQIAVADREGDVVYSNLHTPSGQGAGASIRDREHFRVHADAQTSGLYISKPVMGRVSKVWSIQMTRAIRVAGQFEGVVVVSVAPSYISGFFREILEHSTDVIMLLRTDGFYMARSQAEEAVLGQQVSLDRDFLRSTQAQHGFYEVLSAVDEVERYYAWHRVQGLPLVVSVGLDKTEVWASLNAELRRSLMINGLVSVVLVVTALACIWLAWQRHQSSLEVARSGQLLRRVLDESAAVIFLATRDRCFAQLNQRAQSLFGVRDGSLIGQSLRMMHPDDASFEAFEACYEELRTRGFARREWRFQLGDGSVRWYDVYGTPLDVGDADCEVVWTMVDVDDRHRAEADLRVAQRRLTAIVEQFPGGVMVQERLFGAVVVMNQQMCDLLKLPAPVAPLDLHLVGQIEALLPPSMLEVPQAPVAGQQTTAHSMEQLLPDGRVYEFHRVPLWEGERPLGLFWIVHDITERKQRETDLEHLAATDALTQLPNRRAFMARLSQEFRVVQQALGQPCVLLMVDIDFFKRVNDTWGHAIGDEVLKHLAALLSQRLRKVDMAGRLGGEEFAILLSQTPAAGGLQLAEHLRETIALTPAQTLQGTISFTVSIGVSMLDAYSSSAEEALARADAALYYAKRHGRNRVCVWSETVQTDALVMPRLDGL